ncbi:hypothetical protein ACSIGC_16130 [Tenacibaculum sp. ZS6-P6]|uniref:hypothetical protein n=1 Tax=Tenacibaculum sp. ZS6-P6 TaxID=3447503 RepID=UPI003F9C24DF
MKVKDVIKSIVLVFVSLIFFNCSSDRNEPEIVDKRSFITNTTNDFFINKDGSVNVNLIATYVEDTSFGNVIEKGFVFGRTSNPTVSTSNTSNVHDASANATGYIENLIKDETYFIRGYFKYENGTFFYGNEVQVSTNVDVSSTRTITLEIEDTPFFRSQTEITPILNLSNLTKEMPKEIGYEYSINQDFSNSTFKADSDYDGIHNKGIVLITEFTEVISGLTAGTTYYFRPYAKYNDNTVTNGGANTVTLTTSN